MVECLSCSDRVTIKAIRFVQIQNVLKQLFGTMKGFAVQKPLFLLALEIKLYYEG
jgi:hypothetical protein